MRHKIDDESGDVYICVDDLAKALFDMADGMSQDHVLLSMYGNAAQISSMLTEKIAMQLVGGDLSRWEG